MSRRESYVTLCIREIPTFADSEDPDEMQHNAAFYQQKW